MSEDYEVGEVEGKHRRRVQGEDMARYDNLAKKRKVWSRSGRSPERNLGELQKFCVEGRQERVHHRGIETRDGGQRK